ncbi:SusC/RagA family TonB-linked outer membrane protein [Chitinophaga oryziterrae]|uniref:SusC/RagA family TonB-linked outer membrane protein n=1 Tax=Chitinophaga oryziterrae TaxID=1031224 RepID=A0A6N8J724_9BACT|nr:TonB-dependent receptor [Chitinophaga oryziterrae]MVT40833.1 SusC/RagA family TonB-linked outer membrane protein [Chitinophaga oryziterrae]
MVKRTTTILLTLSCFTAYAQDTMKVRALNETVVIGYGVVKKRDLTGAVYSVKPDVIMQAPTHNPLEALQGRVPGMDITRSSGRPGADANVLIRGTRSISGSSKPLYIIDGMQGGNISDLNPADIASIEVLKDASATAIYGSQGANGVVIVTTKKGSEGKTKVSYNGYYGINGFTQYPKPRLGEDYLKLRREAYRASLNPGDPMPDDATIFANAGEYDAIQKGQWVNWLDLLTSNGTEQQHSISVSGGTEKTKAYFSGGYFKEEGVLKNDNMTRYTVRLSIDQKINNRIKAGIQSQLNYYKSDSRKDVFPVALTTTPLGVPYDANGNISLYPVAGNTTTITPLTDDRGDYISKDQTIINITTLNGYAEIKLAEGWTFRSNFGTTITFNREGKYYDGTSLERKDVRTSLSSITNKNNRFYNWDNIMTYTRQLQDHSFTVTLLTSYTHKDYDDAYASGYNQALASQLFYNLGATDVTSRGITSSYIGSKTMSYAARVNYNYKGKYLLTFSERIDGASRLAAGHKYAGFPSVAAGWRITDAVKLRAGYGIAGNSGIDEYGTQTGVYAYPYMSFGNVAAPGYMFNDLVGNKELGWELSATTNAGVDLDFFNGRLNATIDIYNTKTTDLLQIRTLPQSTGVVKVYQNIGATNNKGIEIGVNTVNIQQNNFKWTSTLTFTSNREKITSLIDGKDVIAASGPETNSLLLNHPVKSFYTYKKLGIWQTSEAATAAQYSFGGTPFKPGDIKLQDKNGDLKITADDDRMYLGAAVPRWTAGFQNNFSYRGLDLGIFLFARWGQMLNAQFLGRYNPSGEGGGPAMINYWTPENPTNDFPRPLKGAGISKYAGFQALNFVDGSYVKIKNITLGYTLPARLAERLTIQRLRVYATGANIFTKARNHLVKYYDPERGGEESTPLNRQFVFGVNVDF